MNKNINKLEKVAIILLFIIIAVGSYFNKENQIENTSTNNKTFYEISDIPEYSGEIYTQINNNIPNFNTEDIKLEEDYYSILENGKVRNGNYKNQLGKSKCR